MAALHSGSAFASTTSTTSSSSSSSSSSGFGRRRVIAPRARSLAAPTAAAAAAWRCSSPAVGRAVSSSSRRPRRLHVAAPKGSLVWFDRLIDSTVRSPYVWYSRALEKRPLVTKACTSFVGFIVGDLIAQHIAHPATVDVLRCLRLGAYGLLIDGPVGSTWYDVLEKYVYPDAPASTKAVLLKTALDQVVYATIMTAVFFAVIKTLEGSPDAIGATLAAKFWPTLAANYAIWPMAHLINFRFVPAPYRILYNNCVCVAWLTGLSLITHTKINLAAVLHGLGLH